MARQDQRPQPARISLAATRVALALACLPLALLAGCPDDSAVQSKTPSNATAPPVAGVEGQSGTATAATQAATAARQTAEANASSQKVQTLIQAAEASYKAGVNDYQQNRLEAARVDFDRAVDMMLSSGMDLKEDPQLSDEFEHLLDAINTVELAALKQGNGLTPKLDLPPVDTVSAETFTADPALTARLKAELNTTSDLPLIINDQVAGYINAFANSPSFRAHMERSLERAGRYKDLIQGVLKEEGVPQDLIYLAVAESGFQPQAMNAGSGAGGMWQFMPTGAYGLARNGYFDERFDPEKSSRAYAKYIKSLYDQFGDWYLAMAAYDWGPGKIQRAVMRTGYADFWKLYQMNAMPKETKNYVPQILAAIIMAKNPDRYGLNNVVPDKAVLYDKINVDYSIDMRLIADVTEVSVAEIAALNPSLLRMTTPRDMQFELHLPAGTKQLYLDRLKDIPEDRRASWRFHIVKEGETVATIAAALHAKVADITATNGITPSDPLAKDDELVVPVQASTAIAGPQRYTIRAGDTLVTIADRFNVSVEELRHWNNLSAASVRPGKTLYVAEPIRLGPATRVRARTRRANGHAGSTSAKSGKAAAASKKKPTTGKKKKTT